MSGGFFSRNNFATKLFSFSSRCVSTLLLSTIFAFTLISTAQGAPSVSLNKTSFTSGETITVTVNGGNSNVQEWIALFVSSNPDSALSFEGKWQYLNAQKITPTTPVPYPATLSFIAPSTTGTYNIRYFAQNGYSNRLAISQNFAVTAPTTVSQTTQQTVCTHYASPTGTGNGSSSSQPFKISNFWPVAKPGDTLCLLDGKYTGVASMINPPQNLSGTASAPITVKAINDGKVTINGQGNLLPVLLSYNDYFVLEGFNAANSKGSVIALSYSNHNILKRIAAWDAADNNTNIFGVHGGVYNLLEDVAGWGTARKIFSASQGGNYTTIRRAWGRWEGSHVVGPKMTYTLAYNNYNMTCENCIGTWSGERVKETYTLLDYYGNPWTGNGAGTYTNYGVNQPYGIFGIDGISTSDDKNAHTKLLGSIAYVRGTDRFAAPQAVYIIKLDSIEVANSIAFIEPGTNTSKKPFSLNNLAIAPGLNLIARNLIGIGSAGSTFASDWQKSSVLGGSSVSAVGNVYNKAGASNLCYRYRDRTLTTEPLWPWPMNQRIRDAMVESGRGSVDVTKTIESMFGPIPSTCTAPGSPSAVSVPATPGNLILTIK